MLRHVFWAAAMLVASPAATFAADGDMVGGKIVGFECADNCYLTIKPDNAEEVTGLCVAEACQLWNEATEIPQGLIGQDAEVTLGTGKQYDAEGNEMGETVSFTEIKTGDF